MFWRVPDTGQKSQSISFNFLLCVSPIMYTWDLTRQHVNWRCENENVWINLGEHLRVKRMSHEMPDEPTFK